MFDTIVVCKHAAERWRERAAQYGDADPRELCAVLKKSRRITTDEPAPLVRKPNTHYYWDDTYQAILVVEPRGLRTCRIVTVVVPGQPFTYQRCKVGESSDLGTGVLPVVAAPVTTSEPTRRLEEALTYLSRQLSHANARLDNLEKVVAGVRGYVACP